MQFSGVVEKIGRCHITVNKSTRITNHFFFVDQPEKQIVFLNIAMNSNSTQVSLVTLSEYRTNKKNYSSPLIGLFVRPHTFRLPCDID